LGTLSEGLLARLNEPVPAGAQERYLEWLDAGLFEPVPEIGPSELREWVRLSITRVKTLAFKLGMLYAYGTQTFGEEIRQVAEEAGVSLHTIENNASIIRRFGGSPELRAIAASDGITTRHLDALCDRRLDDSERVELGKTIVDRGLSSIAARALVREYVSAREDIKESPQWSPGGPFDASAASRAVDAVISSAKARDIASVLLGLLDERLPDWRAEFGIARDADRCDALQSAVSALLTAYKARGGALEEIMAADPTIGRRCDWVSEMTGECIPAIIEGYARGGRTVLVDVDGFDRDRGRARIVPTEAVRLELARKGGS
jgi:ParB-like chromosome segregation protein Spo0J